MAYTAVGFPREKELCMRKRQAFPTDQREKGSRDLQVGRVDAPRDLRVKDISVILCR